jgi:hypothetical protein
MDDVPGDGHCLFGCVQKGIEDMHNGAASPSSQLRHAQEIQGDDGQPVAVIKAGPLNDLKVFSNKKATHGGYLFLGQRVDSTQIVCCIISGPVSLTQHKYLAHVIPL